VSSLAGSLSAPPRWRSVAAPFAFLRGDAALSAGVSSVLAAVAFAADGGLRVERAGWTELGVTVLGCGLVAFALLTGRTRGRLHGGFVLLALAGLAAFTAMSVGWSLAPDQSWLEANRTISYVAAFAGALALARMAPAHWAAILNGVALGSLVVCGWALLTKVFPAALAPEETYARLREPFGYWNASGLMAALAIPPLLWLAARRSGHAAVNALAWPGLGLLIVCLMLSYSRGGLLALLFGLAFWFGAVPLRLRGALALLVTAAAAAPVVAWAFARDALSTDRIPLAARVDAGQDFGALLLLMVGVLLAAGLTANFLAARNPPSARLRRVAGRGLVALVALVPVVTAIAIAAAPGGIGGQTSEAWDQLTNPAVPAPGNTPDRLTATSSVRARYWRESLDVFRASSTIGAGAGSFVVARTRHRIDRLAVRHSHGYVVQTLADLGLVGLGLSLVAAAGWLVAAARATGVRRRDRGLRFDPQRIGLLTMVSVVVVFAVSSLIDWTWLVPGTAIVALLCAAWVAGSGPLRDRIGDAAPSAPASRRPSRGAVLAAVCVMAAGLTAGWAALQPVRAAQAEDAALDAAEHGRYEAAAEHARRASRYNPLAPDPLWQLAFIEDAQGHTAAAQDALEEAATEHPANAEAWRRLGRYRLSVLDDPRGAVEAFSAALYLDPHTPDSSSNLLAATRALQKSR